MSRGYRVTPQSWRFLSKVGNMNKKGLTALAGMSVVAVAFAGANVAHATSTAGTAGTAVAKVSMKVTPNPATHTTPVDLFPAVRPFPASTTAPHPSGSVCFFDGAASTPLICGSLKVSVQGVSSTRVKFTLAAGSHSIQARYSGDTTYASNASKPVLVTVS